jgi:uncharacterized membrane protein
VRNGGVLDSAPDELVQVVGYLQSVTDKVDIDLVTVTAYDVGGSQVLAPQRIEPGRRARELSDAQVSARQSGALHTGSAEFRAVIANMAPAQREKLERLADWADDLEREGLVKLATYKGKTMTTLLPRLAADNSGLVTIYRDGDDGYLAFYRSAFERRAPDSIPVVEALIGASIKQGNTTRQVTEPLLQALTQAYRDAVHHVS